MHISLFVLLKDLKRDVLMCKTIRDTRGLFCAFYAHFAGCIRIYFELLFKFMRRTISKTDIRYLKRLE